MAAVMEEKVLPGLREVALLVFSAFALFMMISLLTFSNEDAGWSHSGSMQSISNSCGVLGAWISDFVLSLFGLMGYLFPLMLSWVGYLIYRDQIHTEHTLITAMRYVGIVMTILFGTALLYLHILRVGVDLPDGSGGVIGQEIGDSAVILLGNSGASLALLVGLLIGITLFTDLSWLYLMDFVGKYTIRLCLFFWNPLDFIDHLLARRQSQVNAQAAQQSQPTPSQPQSTHPEISTPTFRTTDSAELQSNNPPSKITILRSQQAHDVNDVLMQSYQNTPVASSPLPKTSYPIELTEDSIESPVAINFSTPPTPSWKAYEPPVADVQLIDEVPAYPDFQLKTPEPELQFSAQRFDSAPDLVEFITYDENLHDNYRTDAEDIEEDLYSEYEATLNKEKIHVHNYHAAPAAQQPTTSIKPQAPVIVETAPANLRSNESEPKLRITDYTPKFAAPSTAVMQHLRETGDILPGLSLLDHRDTRVNGYSDADLEDMSRLVEDVLQDFNVVVEVVAVHPGPVITRFELQPAAGIKVSRISGLAKDLARALSVTSVRIVEIIPGKSVIGLEIPNQEREIVTLRELLVSNQFNEAKSVLTLAMGKDISGDPVVADLGKMPHALVAGTTGSGKSVAINTMILSLLYKATPEQVRLIMIDPKMLELSVYEGIPHLLTPVVTDMKEAQNALRWAVGEMERRYKLMSKMGVRNLAGFNQLIQDAAAKGEAIRDPMFQYDKPLGDDQEFPVLTTLPSIVIVIDELADMMMIVGKKVEELIARLAQKARAAGIHLILATQRPSVDVLTGLIKANVPTRISFQVSSRIDSRTILDQGGAETLLGNGDMLFLPSGTSIPIRAHGAFVDDHEVHRVVEFLKQTAPPDYLDEITKEISDSSESGVNNPNDDAETDALYDQAVMFVTETRKASISSVQRRFKIGYNRAARMIEDMEAAGVVSPPESNGFREVLAPAPPKHD